MLNVHKERLKRLLCSVRVTCAGLLQKQKTYRQGHGHNHVSTVHRRNVQDTGTCVRVYPLNGTGRLANASRCSTQGWRECPNWVSHQHSRAGLHCNERWRILTSGRWQKWHKSPEPIRFLTTANILPFKTTTWVCQSLTHTAEQKHRNGFSLRQKNRSV